MVPSRGLYMGFWWQKGTILSGTVDSISRAASPRKLIALPLPEYP